MKKLIKIGISLLIVIIITLISIPYLFKDRIEQFIKEEVNNAVNAKVDYKDVSLSLLTDFPNLHVKIEGITVDGINEFDKLRLANIDLFTMSLNAKKLFINKDLEIKKIGIDGADFTIKVLKNGKANYDIAKESTDTITKPEKKYTIRLQSYAIKHTNIMYDDASMNLVMQLKNMNHSGSGTFTNSDYTLQTHTTADMLDVVFDKVHYLNKVKTLLDANILIQNDFSKYTLSNVSASFNDLELTSDMMFELKGDDINMDIVYQTKQNSLKKLLSLIPKAYMPDFNGVKANGAASLKGSVKGTYNEQNYPAYSVDFQINNGTIKYPDLPETVKKINVVTKVDFAGGKDLDNTKINMPVIAFDIAGNTTNGKLFVSHPMSDPDINTSFTSKMDLSKIQQAIKMPGVKELNGLLDADFSLKGRTSAIEKQDFDHFKASGYFNLKNMNYVSDSLSYDVHIADAEMEITPQKLSVTKFDSKVGENDFHITGNLENYIAYFLQKDKVLKANFNMHSNYLNMNEFMSDKKDEKQASDTTQTGIIKIPKNLDITFIADADKVLYEDMDLDNVKGKITVKNQAAKLETILLKTLKGNMKLKGTYDTSGDVAKTDMDMSLEKVSIPESAEKLTVFNHYAPVLQKVSGDLFSNLQLKMNLDDQMNPDLSTLDASGIFNTANLKVAGIGVIQKIGSMLKMSELQQARVDNIKAKFSIDKGNLHINPFQFKLNGMQSALEGNVSLDQKIDFVLDMDIPREKLGNNANQILEGLVGKLSKLGLSADLGKIIKMKFRISGDYNNPKIVPVIKGTEGSSAKEMVTQAVEEKVEQVVDDTKEKARAEAKKKADALLANAQQQADKLVAEAKKQGDRLKSEAKKQGDALIKKAGNDPFKKLAAQTIAKNLNKEADKKAKQLENTARNKADLIMKDAHAKADKLLAE